MIQWKQLTVPPICERLIGFSVPVNNKILVISYEGTHLINLNNNITVKHDYNFCEYDIYDPESGLAYYQEQEYKILGLHGGKPITTNLYGETLELNFNSETIAIHKQEKIIYSVKYTNFSGDWAVATFSGDGKYIILGCPYDFDFVVWQRN